MSERFAFAGRKVGVFLGGVSAERRSPSGRERRPPRLCGDSGATSARSTSGRTGWARFGTRASTRIPRPARAVRGGRLHPGGVRTRPAPVHGVRGRRLGHRDEQSAREAGGRLGGRAVRAGRGL